jgi:hypothetical protein
MLGIRVSRGLQMSEGIGKPQPAHVSAEVSPLGKETRQGVEFHRDILKRPGASGQGRRAVMAASLLLPV